MKAPAFWNRPPGIIARLLAPLGWIYGAVTSRRMRRTGIAVDAPVVCIGNFTAGGAGKTPAAMAMAELLRDAGFAPAFLSRGYGGSLAGPVRVDPALHRPRDCGDEPLLLARAAPTVVSADRVAGARLALAAGADIIVMDDGLQNPSLAKDVAIAVVDGAAGVGNGLCIPAGPLRAPLSFQLPLVDAVLVVGSGDAGDKVAAAAADAGKAVLRAELAPDAADVAAIAGKQVFAFAGIGRPQKFFDTLAAAGIEVRRTRSFADHAPYDAGTADSLIEEASQAGLALITTEKDLVRWPSDRAKPQVLRVRMALAAGDAERLLSLVSGRRRSAR